MFRFVGQAVLSHMGCGVSERRQAGIACALKQTTILSFLRMLADSAVFCICTVSSRMTLERVNSLLIQTGSTPE